MEKKKFLHNKWVIGFLVLPFFEPSGVEEMAVYIGGMWTYLNLFFSVTKYAAFAVLILFLLQELARPSSVFIIVALYEFYILVMAFISGNLNISGVSTVVTVVGGALLFDYYLRGQSAYKFIDIASKILEILIILNLFSVILYPNGMYTNKRLWTENFLFGYKNVHIYMYLPYVMLKTIQQYIKKSRLGKDFYFMVAVIVLSSVLSGSKTTSVAIIIYAVMTLLFQHTKFLRRISIWKTYLVSIVLSCLVVVFNIQNYFSSFLNDLMGKDISLSSRTLIWERALSGFWKNPILGNGLVSYNDIFSNWTVSQMHNMYMDILVVGGCVLFTIFSVMMFKTSKKHQQIEWSSIYNMILCVYIGFFILFITEAKREPTSFIACITLTYYIPELIERYDIKVAKTSRKIIWRR